MRLKRGEKVPLFSINSYNGEDVELLKLEGSKVLLSFFRGASCPFCNMRIRELISRYDDFKNTILRSSVFLMRPMKKLN